MLHAKPCLIHTPSLIICGTIINANLHVINIAVTLRLSEEAELRHESAITLVYKVSAHYLQS